MKANYIVALATFLLIFSCVKRDESVFGPEYLGAPEDLEVVGNSFDIEFENTLLEDEEVVDFSNSLMENYIQDTVFFNATLSDSVTWQLTIKGEKSGAIKTLIGTGYTFNNAYWVGESENIAFFSKGEVVTITLSFIGIKKKIVRTLEFGSPRLFPDVILVTDFELQTDIQGIVKSTEDDADGWFEYFDETGSKEGISRGIGPKIGPQNIIILKPELASVPVKSIQGDGYFHIRGKDYSVMPSPFFIGGFGHDAITYGLPLTDPSNVYLNFYANPNGNRTTKLVIELSGIGGDLFTKEIGVDWDGWKLISVRLSDFSLNIGGVIGTKEILTPQLKQMKFAIHSGNVAGNLAEINIDYVTFTVGKPFKQQ